MTNDLATRLMTRVRQFRETLGLSQEAFAERAGLKYKHYQSIEAGRKSDIRFSTLQKLARACGLQPWQLLDFDSEVPALGDAPASYQSSRRRAASGRKVARKTAARRQR